MSKPRQSGIPTPGRPSGIPTPGRSRSSSSANNYPDVPAFDPEYMTRAFADAIKHNDPAQHRASRASDVSTASLSPLTMSYSAGSMSGRPSSVASSSSAVSSSNKPKTYERAKTPTSARPQSRQSDVFARSSSRAGKVFDVGDNVRIESLGFEGTLRYLGEIDGKPGLWAGVELSGGFVGKGKNNGSVGGKAYFACPDKCGVFVATSKLSAPTVGPGAYIRPSSVASSRGGGGGRVTPSLSGRVTPSTSIKGTTRAAPSISVSNGRVTPAGRTTPSNLQGPDTPAARAARMRALAKQHTTPTASSKTAPLSDKITNGSRASKYVSMTAKQLSTINGTPTRGLQQPQVSSPTSMTRTMSSPSRSTGSPFMTPKPRISSAGNSTPRPRIPSAVAMPPPASPSSKAPRTADDDSHGGASLSSVDLESRGRALQEKIASLSSLGSSKPTWGAAPSSPRRSNVAITPSSPRRSGSSASIRSTTTEDQLQSRIDALEYENERLRASAASLPSPNPPTTDDSELAHELEGLKTSHSTATSRISELEESLSTAESSLASRDSHIASLTTSHEDALRDLEASAQLNSAKLAEMETHNRDLETRLEDSEELVRSLKKVVEEKTSAEDRNDQLISAKEAEWAVVEGRLRKVNAELEEEKKELGIQVDELRSAGQETIALYEERLRASEVLRYDLEDRLADLDSKLRIAQSPAVSSPPRSVSSATTQIDNEALQDQVHHLQKKVSTLEDLIEDSRAAAEREEAAMRDRMRRVKEKEDVLRRELGEGRKETERVMKEEARARGRVEEIEEALRESTVALENARAEVEGLRAELDNLNGLVASSSSSENLDIIKSLEAQNTMLKQRIEDHELQIASSHQELDQQAGELESLRKKLNRDVPIGNGHDSLKPSSPASPSKHDLSSAREEIKGLKHIVQELQKEVLSATQQNKLLRSENQLLGSETDQLRQEVKILEENIDQSIMREEQALDNDVSSGSDDVDSLRQSLKEQRLKLETELDQLRKRLADAEMKNARTTHDLNTEISELEALVESKIYREDELEQEIERLKDKLSRQKKSSKNSMESVASTLSATSAHDQNVDVCEICERPGHDIFNCDLLKGEEVKSAASSEHKVSLDLFCEECESHGHLAADCPDSLDVF